MESVEYCCHLYHICKRIQGRLAVIAFHNLQNVVPWEGIHKDGSNLVICQGRFGELFEGSCKLLEELDWGHVQRFCVPLLEIICNGSTSLNSFVEHGSASHWVI